MALSLNTTPTSCSWNMYAGDANSQTFLFVVNGAPWDVSGFQIKAQARVTPTSATVAMTATVTIESLPGHVTIAWNGETMRTLLDANGRWAGVWDLQVLQPGHALPDTLLVGPVTITQDVTRP